MLVLLASCLPLLLSINISFWSLVVESLKV
jgi:hypothetical protein